MLPAHSGRVSLPGLNRGALAIVVSYRFGTLAAASDLHQTTLPYSLPIASRDHVEVLRERSAACDRPWAVDATCRARGHPHRAGDPGRAQRHVGRIGSSTAARRAMARA